MWSDGTPFTLHDFKALYDWALGSTRRTGPDCSGLWRLRVLLSIRRRCIEGNRRPDRGPLRAGEPVRRDHHGRGRRTVAETVFWKQNFSDGSAPRPAHQPAAVLGGRPGGRFGHRHAGRPGHRARADERSLRRHRRQRGAHRLRPERQLAAERSGRTSTARFRFFGSKDGMITSFLNGEIDLTLDMTQADFPAIPCVDPRIGRAQLDTVWQYEHLDLQTAHPTSASTHPAVRTAIAWPSTRQDLVDVLFPGPASSRPARPPRQNLVAHRARVPAVRSRGRSRCARRCRLGAQRGDRPSREGVTAMAPTSHALPHVHELGQPDPPDDPGQGQPVPRCHRHPERTSDRGCGERLLRRLGGHDARDAVHHLPRHVRRRAVRLRPGRRPVQQLLLHLPLLADPSDRIPNGSNNTRISVPELDDGARRPGQLDRPRKQQMEAAADGAEGVNASNARSRCTTARSRPASAVHVGGFTYNPSSAARPGIVESVVLHPLIR